MTKRESFIAIAKLLMESILIKFGTCEKVKQKKFKQINENGIYRKWKISNT